MAKEGEALERVYTIPLRRVVVTPRHRRAKRAINIIREFAIKHTKAEEVRISAEVNERIWERGIEAPPRRITVKIVKNEEGIVTVSLPAEETPTEG